MQHKIKEHSTRPLDIIEEKTEDEYLLLGIDIHDKEQSKQIQKLKDINAKNSDLIGNCSKQIKDIH